MFARKLTKAKKKEIFFEPYLNCLLLSLSSLFAAKIVRFLRLITSLLNAKFVLSLSGLQGWINPLEFALKKLIFMLSQFFCSNLGSNSNMVSYNIWPWQLYFVTYDMLKNWPIPLLGLGLTVFMTSSQSNWDAWHCQFFELD